MTGIEETSSISSIIGFNSFGPSEQFTPNASTPKPSTTFTNVKGSVPVKVRLFCSKVIVTKTGKSLFSFTASIAALTSYKSVIVSNNTTST